MNATCRRNGPDQPRTLAGRHHDYCPTPDTCPGCQPCAEPHCRICNRTHADGACAECLADARTNLHDIARMCDALPEEVEHRGIDGEAMMLLGPVANPEARGHLEASVAAGRIPADRLDPAHELHPLFILGCWDMVWRDALEHDDPDEAATLPGVIDYLDRQITYMAGYEHLSFEDFARDLRRCRAHLEAVLHDQRQGDRANVGCFECGGDLERRIGTDGFEDVWTCRRCTRRYTYPEYNFALRAKLEAELEEPA